jgi:aminoglycoside 3-N-acetyltransferase
MSNLRKQAVPDTAAPIASPAAVVPAKHNVAFREIGRALEELALGKDRPVLVHSSLKAFGQVQGGAETVIGALLKYYDTVVMPTFTYKTLIVPESGPPDNAVDYGAHHHANKMAEFFHPDMTSDRLVGIIPETLRHHPEAFRSGHPVLSFTGINARSALEKQTLSEPFAPIASLTDAGGYVLLMGVDHTANTSIHLGERLAGRKTFTRWALMPDMIVKLQNFPHCSDGFNVIKTLMDPFTRSVTVGRALIQALPLYELVETTRQLISTDPLALLCNNVHCPSCNQIRRDVKSKDIGSTI